MQEKNLTADYWKAVETLFPAAAQTIKELCDQTEKLEADIAFRQKVNNDLRAQLGTMPKPPAERDCIPAHRDCPHTKAFTYCPSCRIVVETSNGE